ncbi:hypothetical protein AQ909_01380 [Burkholderia pseudomallei]|nr:hypothetical protein AQ909_01380 [Burkholderia pseudomallei]
MMSKAGSGALPWGRRHVAVGMAVRRDRSRRLRLMVGALRQEGASLRGNRSALSISVRTAGLLAVR